MINDRLRKQFILRDEYYLRFTMVKNSEKAVDWAKIFSSDGELIICFYPREATIESAISDLIEDLKFLKDSFADKCEIELIEFAISLFQ